MTRIGVLVLAGAALVLGAALIIVQTDAFQQWALRRIEMAARAQGYRLAAERLRISIWTLQAQVEKLVFDDGRSARVTVDRLVVQVPWNIFTAPIHRIIDFEADGAVIDLRAAPSQAGAPPGNMDIPRVVFDKLSIHNASLTYADSGRTIRIPSFNLDLQNGRGALRLSAPVTISPDVELAIPELALQMSEDALDFGPSDWRAGYSDLRVEGASRGRVQWRPSLVISADYSTRPFSYQNWRNIESAASIRYANGTLTVTDFRAQSGRASATGHAELGAASNSATVNWTALDLTPAGVPAVTEGNADLHWAKSDFSDVAGAGSVHVESRQYGRADADVALQNGRAHLNVRATAFEANIRADLNAGFDQRISGTFEAVHSRYGDARLGGTVSGSLKDPRAAAVLTANRISYNGVGPLNATANVTYGSGVLAINAIRAQLKQTTIPDGFLRADLNTQQLSGQIPQIFVQLPDFAPQADGGVVMSANIEGSVQKPMARIAGSSNGIDVSGTHIDSIQLSGEADATQFRLTELTARQGDGALRASGSYNFSNRQIGAGIDVSDLNITQLADASATASVTAHISGSVDAPLADFSGKLTDVRYRDQQHGDLEIGGTVQNNTASVRIESAKYAAEAAAEIGLKEPYSFTASIKANDSHVSYQQYSVAAKGVVEASGALKPFAVARVRFDDFHAAGEGVNLQASGTLPEGANINADAELSRLPLQSVELQGQAQIHAVVSGPVTDPQIQGELETSGAAVKAAGMAEAANIQAAVDFNRKEFSIRRLQAAFAGASAEITGRGTIEGVGHLQFRAQEIRPERMVKDAPVTGVISLEGDIDVAKPALDGISGSAKVTQFDVNVKDIPIHQVAPMEVQIENQVLSARNVAIEGLNTRAVVTGTANLRTRALNLNVEGNTDLKILEAVLPGSHPSGAVRTQIAIRGTPENPNLEGFLNVADMQLDISDPPVSISGASAEIQLRGDRVEIAKATGTVNNGALTASGGTTISSAGLGETSIQATLDHVQTEYPEGFQSEISSRLALKGSGTNLELSGDVDILRGAYTRDISLTEEVLSRITANAVQGAAGQTAGPGAIDRIKLSLAVSTPDYISVTNNLANFQMEGALQVRGTVANPVITGRARVAEGGEIYFGPQVGTVSDTGAGRRDRYIISEGSIDFNNSIRTEPSFDISATRQVEVNEEQETTTYTITLHASGTAEKPKMELTSDPPLDQPNIVSVLLTGRTLKNLQGSEAIVAQEQAANFIAGQFGNLVQNAGSTFGLNTVRIDPVLLAKEAGQGEDLSAKLTIGKDITPDFNFVYSQNLSGARAQTWIANYQPIKDLLLRGINRSDENSLTFELRHDLKWGGGPPLAKGPAPKDERTLGKVTFDGTTVPEKELLKQVTKSGKPFNAYRLNDDVHSLQQFFADKGFLKANIRAVRNPHDDTVDIQFVVDEGPSITFVFEGANVPDAVRQDIRQIWIRGFSEAESLRETDKRLLRHLQDEGYLQAELSSRDDSPDSAHRRFVFIMTPGTKFPLPRWVFKGVDPIPLNVTAGTVLQDPKAIQDRIQNELWKNGYLNASCTEPRLILDDGAPRFEISVERGPRYSIGAVTANHADYLRELPPGEGGDQPAEGAFTSAWLNEARQTIISKYWANGFNDVQVDAETHVPDRGTTVDVDFQVDPGEVQAFTKIEIEGNKTTSLDYIRRQFTFNEGDPVDYTRVNSTRKNLYDTRLFRRVELNTVKGDDGYIAKLSLNEQPPWNFRYGFAVTDQLETSDRQLGGTADFSYSNLFGRGITTGTSFSYTADLRDGRIFASLPSLFGRKVTTTGAVFRTRDLRIEGSITDLTGFTVQQQWQLKDHYLLSYDYRYEKNHTFDKELDPDNPFAFDLTVPIARLNGTLSRDTRNDILNAASGTFLSNSFAIAPPGIGSSIQFFRNFTQYLRFKPVGDRLVWASAFRVGVAKGFHGQQLLPEQQFLAGGGTTVRGFQQDKLTDPGNALLVLNQELRFPMFWRFSGAGFMDAGNVYPAISNFDPFKLRYSPGAGVRVQTPLVLIRFDAGVNVFPRVGEPRYRFSFGIGQAF